MRECREGQGWPRAAPRSLKSTCGDSVPRAPGLFLLWPKEMNERPVPTAPPAMCRMHKCCKRRDAREQPRARHSYIPVHQKGRPQYRTVLPLRGYGTPLSHATPIAGDSRPPPVGDLFEALSQMLLLGRSPNAACAWMRESGRCSGAAWGVEREYSQAQDNHLTHRKYSGRIAA